MTNPMKPMLMIVTTEGNYYIPDMCEIDEEGSLVRFYLDGILQFSCARESFKFCERVEK
jgi:hypothetical protein